MLWARQTPPPSGRFNWREAVWHLRAPAAVESGPKHRANLSAPARRYLERLDASVEDLFYHVLAVLHDPAYREANADALRLGWPRIPLPDWPGPPVSDDRQDDVRGADALAASAARGRELARLLDPERPVPGVTRGPLEAPAAVIAVPTTIDGTYMVGDDFAVTAGWGHAGQGRAVMPGQGRLRARGYSNDERAAIADAAPALGDTTVYLNGRAFWRNVPTGVTNEPSRNHAGHYPVMRPSLLRVQTPIWPTTRGRATPRSRGKSVGVERLRAAPSRKIAARRPTTCAGRLHRAVAQARQRPAEGPPHALDGGPARGFAKWGGSSRSRAGACAGGRGPSGSSSGRCC